MEQVEDAGAQRGLTPEQDDDEEHLFLDEDFPADRSMLTDDAPQNVVWRRPRDLCEEPEMFVDGASRSDVLQGGVGDCWSMAACAAVAEHPELIRRVVPQGQILHGMGYTGRIIIRFWHMNHWRDMEIDDRLPVYDDELIYAQSSSKREFWMPLVEKAFAKFHGGYQNLVGGQLSEGFINLTGFSVRTLVVEFYREDNLKNALFKFLKNEFDNKSLIVAARDGTFTRGLPGAHGYTITGVRHLRSAKQRLLRLRNPWGDDEWTGKWRDDHDIWKEISADILEELDYKVQRDGEFWMGMADFMKLFEEICIGSNRPSVHAQISLPATEEKVIREFWTKETSGGPLGSSTFSDNPQILLDAIPASTDSDVKVTMENLDEDDDEPENENDTKAQGGLCTENATCPEVGIPVFVELLQDHNRRVYGTDLLNIDFCVFKVAAGSERAGEAVSQGRRLTLTQLTEECERVSVFHSLGPLSVVSSYIHLEPEARYVVVPHTESPGEERRFLLRVYVRNAHVHLRLLGDAVDGEAAKAQAPAEQ